MNKRSKQTDKESAVVAAKKPAVRQITLADLDVLPPAPRALRRGAPVTIEVLEKQIGEFLQADFSREQAWKNEAVYDRVSIGLCLLKGRELHAQKGGRPAKCGNVSAVSKKEQKALAKAEAQIEQGFTAWVEERFPGLQIRTARNYMNGARNCGLTSDHNLEDVDALRVTQALHDKTAKELYRLAEPLKNTASDDDDAPPPSIVADSFHAAKVAVDALRDVRDQMGPEEYETTWQFLKSALEDLTGCAWEMTDAKPGVDGVEHGTQQPYNNMRALSKALDKKGAKAK